MNRVSQQVWVTLSSEGTSTQMFHRRTKPKWGVDPTLAKFSISMVRPFLAMRAGVHHTQHIGGKCAGCSALTTSLEHLLFSCTGLTSARATFMANLGAQVPHAQLILRTAILSDIQSAVVLFLGGLQLRLHPSGWEPYLQHALIYTGRANALAERPPF